MLALVAMTLTILTTTATPTLASVSKGATVLETYVTRSGFLVESDTRVDCRGFDQLLKEYKDTKPHDPRTWSDLKQAPGVLRYCKEHGYRSREDTQAKSAPPKGSLPDTGGANFLVLGAGILLTAGGLLYRRSSR
ncbi:MAG: LPXTG cell wall anchor domain-containing protein [Rubrobacteraceae bacterium]